MVQTLRRWVLVLLAAGLAGAAGCSGSGQGISIPYLMPNDDVALANARPPGTSRFTDIDPHAVSIQVLPADATNPVRTQYALVATVLDESGQPRPRRRVEWMLEGAGNILKVDESGTGPDRGGKQDNH